MKNFFNIYKENLFLLLFALFIFIGSVYQGKYIYDGFHWGLVASNAEDYLNQKLPYKDFFVHYGFLTVVFHALALKFFSSIYSILIFSSIIYSTSMYLLADLVKKICTKKNLYFFIIIILFMQPFIVYPWHTYLILFFTILAINFFIKNTLISFFFFGLSLQLGQLSSESYKIFSFLAIFTSILIITFDKKFNKFKYKKIASIFLGYIVPFLVFFIYLIKNNLVDQWLLHSKIPEIFLKQINLNLFEAILKFIENYITSLKYFLASPYIIFGLTINLICIFYIIRFFVKKEKNTTLLLISIFALLLNFLLVYRNESFRFFCGPIIGIILIFYFVEKIKNFELRYVIIISIICLSILSNPFEKGHSNKNFTNISTKKSSSYADNVNFFYKMKFTKDTWIHLNQYRKILDTVKEKCVNIKYFYNSTQDHFYYLISLEKFTSIQKIPGYSEGSLKSYYDSLNAVYDVTIANSLKSNVNKNNILIIRENLEKDYLKIQNDEISLKTYQSLELPFSYNNKQKKIFIPKNCYL